jgi:hypothetical protein
MGSKLEDRQLFATEWHEPLRIAVEDLSWLLSRGYSASAALKLVGDRHGLDQRQRKAVSSCSCTDEELAAREERRRSIRSLRDRAVAIDGFNTLITIETALEDNLVLVGRDGCCRDLAGVHGAYRSRGETTREAVRLVAGLLDEHGAGPVTWYLDRPVSNSGQLRTLLHEEADWRVELHADPDRHLATTQQLVVTSDRWVLDRCARWVDLVGELIRDRPGVWLLDLGGGRAGID